MPEKKVRVRCINPKHIFYGKVKFISESAANAPSVQKDWKIQEIPQPGDEDYVKKEAQKPEPVSSSTESDEKELRQEILNHLVDEGVLKVQNVEEEILRLRKEGLIQKKISEQLGVTPSKVQRVIAKVEKSKQKNSK